MKPWRLTEQAERSLIDIALWTIDRFGPALAAIYEQELLERCAAVACGHAVTQDCSILIDASDALGLRFTRAGEHFAVFLDRPDEIIFIDFVHARTNLPARIAALRSREEFGKRPRS
ncbi:type II toxin-antitoxin system RelE/ParE family toxin [Rhodovulum kholense]|uniref:ParE-like toxin of type II ParDE toxin-antitoxin system n=1 Tax=Rhodovulum kholense TaxID=453584 RepID=A0A8E2VH89_9RHOB|nr:type II toxin-antitoxin system RelE/ParE family toxin [Rhodovulum kholense]PTW44033.1 ParE-like toxin of type II ParDE toxin-antitoxin system [Rhodovulum kholense]